MSMLTAIITSLEGAVEVSWNNGDFDAWKIWARRMRNIINSSLEMLRVLNVENNKLQDRINQLELINLEKDRLIALLASKGFNLQTSEDQQRKMDIT